VTSQSSPAGPAGELATPAEAGSHSHTGLIHLGFVLTGVVNTFLGPLLPQLLARWSIDDLRAGYLFTSQFTGSMVGVILSTFFLARLGYQRSISFGYGLMGLGIATLGLGSWALGLMGAFVSGLGLGLTIPLSNLLIAGANPDRRAANLSTLNLAWGIGAVSLPVIVAVSAEIQHTTLLLLGLGLAAGLVSARFAWISFADSVETRCSKRSSEGGAYSGINRLLLILGLLFFLYVGTEAAISGWAATYAQRMTAAPGKIAVLTPSFFWGGLILGRALVPMLLRRATEIFLARLGLLLAGVGVVITLAAHTVAIVMAGSCLAGLGLAPVFPITIAHLSYQFEAGARHAAGAIFALAGLGGATLPWVVGYVSDRLGGLRSGLVVPLLGIVLMSIVYVAAVKPEPHPHGSA
jgi:FHS family glucose/mannose:H+ symporter-like MFS transporter